MNRYNPHILFLFSSVPLFCILSASTAADDFGIQQRNSRISSPFFSVAASVPPKEAAGSSFELAGELPNIVRIISYDNAGQSLGSGSYIGCSDNYGFILSNWHIINEADGLIHVHFPGGFSSFGYVILFDKKWDLALIAISRPPSVSPLPIARHVPEIGEPLWIAGFGSGTYRLAKGGCVRYMAPEIPKDGSSPVYEILDLSVSARQGDSGGPILNKNGELAGVLFGSDMVHNTAGSHCIRVSKFLAPMNEKLQKLPMQPEVLFAAVEPNGPKHSLYESRNTVSSKTLTAESPRNNSAFDNTGSGFGVRPPSRHYTQPNSVNSSSSYTVPNVPPIVPVKTELQNFEGEKPQIHSADPPSVTEKYFDNRTADRSLTKVRPAVWNPSLKETVNSDVPAVPLPFNSDLSALNPSGSKPNPALEAALPKLNGTYQTASYNETYKGTLSAAPQLVPMARLSETQVKQIGKSVPLTPASFTCKIPSSIWFGCFGVAAILVLTGIRLLRYDAVLYIPFR